jgi:transposase
MSRLTKLTLNDDERAALETGYKTGSNHGFRQRCQMILLKSQRKSSQEIANQLGCCMIVVNNWVKRYKQEGIDGLHIRKGRGRKQILCKDSDMEAIRRAVSENRQRLSLAQEALQKELGKEFCPMTLKRFLKSITADTNAFVEK